MLDDLDEIFLGVVDRARRAQFLTGFAFLGIARRGEDRRAERLRDLNRGGADTA